MYTTLLVTDFFEPAVTSCQYSQFYSYRRLTESIEFTVPSLLFHI